MSRACDCGYAAVISKVVLTSSENGVRVGIPSTIMQPRSWLDRLKVQYKEVSLGDLILLRRLNRLMEENVFAGEVYRERMRGSVPHTRWECGPAVTTSKVLTPAPQPWPFNIILTTIG